MSYGRRTREWPPKIGPLWMERFTLLEDLETVGLKLPGWKALEQEAEGVRERIRRGELAWPPREGDYAAMLARNGRLGYEPHHFDPHSFISFVGLPSVVRILQYMDVFARRIGQSPGLVDTTAHELYHLARWRHFGRRVYVLDRDTFELLAHTQLPKLPARLLRAPVPSFYVRFPDNIFHFDVAGDPVPQPAEGVFVAFHTPEGETPPMRELSLLTTGRSPHDASDDNVAFAAAAVGPDTPISDIVLPGSRDTSLTTGETELSVLVPRMVLALCLYLDSEHPELEPVTPERRDPMAARSAKKRKRAERQNARTTKLPYVHVGRPLPADGAPAEPGASAGGEKRTGRPLEHRVWVQGYFRRQVHGPARSLRTWRWVRPHWRGPDLTESTRLRAARVQPARRRTHPNPGAG